MFASLFSLRYKPLVTITKPPGAAKAFKSSLSITPKCQGKSGRSDCDATQRPTEFTYFCKASSFTNGAAPSKLPVISRPKAISSSLLGFFQLMVGSAASVGVLEVGIAVAPTDVVAGVLVVWSAFGSICFFTASFTAFLKSKAALCKLMLLNKQAIKVEIKRFLLNFTFIWHHLLGHLSLQKRSFLNFQRGRTCCLALRFACSFPIS